MSDPVPGAQAEPPAPAESQAPSAVTLTPAELESRILARIAQAERRWKRDQDPAIAEEERRELQALRDARAEAERKKAEEKGEYAKALASLEKSIRDQYDPEIKKRDDVIRRQTERMQRSFGHDRLVAAAAASNAIQPHQVAKLLSDQIRLDDDFELAVIDEHGVPRHVAGRPMTVDQLAEEYLRANPHLVKPTGASGSGAQGGRTTAATGQALSALAALEAEKDAIEKEMRQNPTHYALGTKLRDVSRRLREAKSAAS